MCQSHSTQHTFPASDSRLKPSTFWQRHHAACTHLNLTRLFDPDDSQRCYMCGRTSSLGWLYRCTQDYKGFLPVSDILSVRHQNDDSSTDEESASSRLSQSVLRGVKHGLYSGQQIELLEAQKLRVVQSIAIHEEEMEDTSDSSDSSGNYYITPNAASESPRPDPTDTPAPSKSSSADTGDGVSQDATADTQVVIGIDMTFETPNVVPLITKCQFRCCPNCRPVYRDRAFQSLDGLLREPFRSPPPWELENRRVSDANLLRSLSASLLRPQLRRMPQKYGDLRDLGEIQAAYGDDEEVGDPALSISKGKPRARKGLRATVRKAFVALEGSKNGDEPRIPSANSAGEEASNQPSRTVLLKRRREEPEQEDMIISNEALPEPLTHMLAASTPLPRTSDESESSEIDVVRVENGVAVTEEGVGLNTADIIVQG